jgi:hypothetical protein
MAKNIDGEPAGRSAPRDLHQRDPGVHRVEDERIRTPRHDQGKLPIGTVADA